MCSRERGRANERIYGVGRCHQDGAMALSYRTRNSLSAPMSMKQSCISSVYTIYSRNNAPRALSLDQSATRHYSEPDLSTERPGAHRAAALHTASLAPTQHRGVLGNHHASPRLDCRPAVCVQRANRARQQSARASQRECRDCKEGQRQAKPIGKGGAHPSGKGASSSGMRWSAPVPGRPSTRARPRWALATPPCCANSAARGGWACAFLGILRAC